MHKVGDSHHHHHPHCHKHHRPRKSHRPEPGRSYPVKEGPKGDRASLSAEAGQGQSSSSHAAHTAALAANFGAQAPSWRETMPGNWKTYIEERAPNADNNQAAGIAAILTGRLARQ